jgi:hypothetical protein
VPRALLLLSLLLLACGQPRNRCDRSCSRMGLCARQLKQEQTIDVSECIDECNKLDREPNMQHFVDEHVRCVDQAGDDCARVLKCQ